MLITSETMIETILEDAPQSVTYFIMNGVSPFS